MTLAHWKLWAEAAYSSEGWKLAELVDATKFWYVSAAVARPCQHVRVCTVRVCTVRTHCVCVCVCVRVCVCVCVQSMNGRYVGDVSSSTRQAQVERWQG